MKAFRTIGILTCAALSILSLNSCGDKKQETQKEQIYDAEEAAKFAPTKGTWILEQEAEKGQIESITMDGSGSYTINYKDEEPHFGNMSYQNAEDGTLLYSVMDHYGVVIRFSLISDTQLQFEHATALYVKADAE